MNLPTLDKLAVRGKDILLRLDLDVPMSDGEVLDDSRLLSSIPTIKFLLKKNCARITILGHMGRPGGRAVENLSLEPLAYYFEELLEKELGRKKVKELDMFMMENLRFNPGEEGNDEHFAEHLAEEGDVFVNDAFAASRRTHASIVGVPKFLPHAAGIRFAQEVEVLSKILQSPQKPVVFLVGGGKEDKAKLLDSLARNCDLLLIAGVLPKQDRTWPANAKIATLTKDLNDISPDSISEFSNIIRSAGTFVWNGPMGDIDKGYEAGTREIAQGFSQSQAYKVVGGGDTVAFLKKLRLSVKMDWISTGGGAMLEFLAYGDLPGLEALRK